MLLCGAILLSRLRWPDGRPDDRQFVDDCHRRLRAATDRRREHAVGAVGSRAAARRARDLDAILDASAPRAFRDGLVVAQANLSSAVPRPDTGPRKPLRYRVFEHFIGAADAEESPQESVAAKLAEQGSSDNWVSPVRLRFALGGTGTPAGRARYRDRHPFVVARYDDEWRLVGDLTLMRRPPGGIGLWSFAGARATDAATLGGQSVVASYPGTEGITARVVAMLPDAVRSVTDFWGPRWPQRALVITTASTEQFGALAASEGQMSRRPPRPPYTRPWMCPITALPASAS